MERQITVLGIPLPSDSLAFLLTVGIHILFGLVSVISGFLVCFQKKGTRFHVLLGQIYYFGIWGVFASSILLSIIRWPFDNYLLILGTTSLSLAYLGRRAKRQKWKCRRRLHATFMSTSFIVMLTAFYVDNGKNLPLWKLLPEIYFWILPSAIGIPLLAYSLLRNPLTKKDSRND